MPEMLEVEYYRRLADEVVGRRVRAAEAPDAWYLKGGTDAQALAAALVGRRIVGTRRIGKLLLLDTDGPTLGLRFGMTGRLLVDGRAVIEKLEYGSDRSDPAWDRFTLRFPTGGSLVMRDPRRLGAVELAPDESRLGPDAASIGVAGLTAVLAGSDAPLKARLMDQARLAGLGNLLTDETLWRAGLDPARAAGSLGPAEVRRLHRTMRAVLRELDEAGGSHLGRLQVARAPGASCPRDGTPLLRRQVGGRTTYSCPAHQR